MRSLFISFAVTLAVPASVYAADDFSMSVTNTLNIEWVEDTFGKADAYSQYGFGANKLNVVGRKGDLSFWVRLDARMFSGVEWAPMTWPGVGEEGVAEEDILASYPNPYTSEVYPRRTQLQYKLGDWKLTGGDFYKEVGRGLALSLRKGDEVSTDTSILGSEVVYSSRNHGLSLFGGVTNHASLDPVQRYNTEWKKDKLAGLTYELRSLDSIKLGTYGVFFQPEDAEAYSATGYTSMAGGLTVEGIEITEWLSFYSEVATQLVDVETVNVFTNETLSEQEKHFAAYATADLMFGDTLILVEGLMLDDWELFGTLNTGSSYDVRSYDAFDYSRPPTLQRLKDEVVSKSDVIGGRVRVEQYFEDYDLTLYVNGLYRINGKKTDINDGRITETHGFGGLEYNYDDGSSRIKSEFGYRSEDYFTTPVSGEKNVKTMMHGYVDWVHALGGGYSLQVNSDTEFRNQTSKEYFKGQTAIGIAKSGLGDAAVEIGYDADKQFYAGLLTWKMSGGWHLKAVAGSRRGGLKCINGLCRIYPEYRGASLELVSRF